MRILSGDIMRYILILLFFITTTTFATPLTSEELEEARQGKEFYDEILQKSKISSDSKTLERIKKVGYNIAKVVDKEYEWEFALIEDKALNAFCLSGGKVVFFTGIFSVIENDNQLAAVMSHEIAHVLLRHGGMKAKADAILSIPQAVGKGLFGDLVPKELHGVLDTVYETGKNLTVMMPYGREQESEADREGVRLMKKAGYDPKEAIKLWENIKAKSKNELQVPDFLSTHPNYDERIRVIKEEIKK
jgi:predicted Zn-dependent protease